MRNNSIFAAVLTVTLGLVLAACGGDKKNNSAGDIKEAAGALAEAAKPVTEAAKTAAKSADKASPASDFTYDLSEDGKGVVIKKYTGKGGKVVIPAEIEGLPVVELGWRSFYGEDSSSYGPGQDITSVVIPAGVKKIGGSAFTRIKKLTSVTFLGSGTVLGSWVFSDCTELAALVFPEGDNPLVPADEASKYAFDGDKKLPLAMRAKLKAMGFNEP